MIMGAVFSWTECRQLGWANVIASRKTVNLTWTKDACSMLGTWHLQHQQKISGGWQQHLLAQFSGPQPSLC